MSQSARQCNNRTEAYIPGSAVLPPIRLCIMGHNTDTKPGAELISI
jgi:hypothetical protein